MKKKQKSSLKNRALSQTAVLIIVTMCIMVTVFYMVFHSRAFNERGKYEEENLVNMEAYLNSYLEEVDSIAKNVNYNYYLQDYLETVIKEEDDYVDSGIGKNMRSYEMSSQAFSDTLLSRQDISSIMIFGRKKLLLNKSIYSYRNVVMDYSGLDWYKKALENPDDMIITGPNAHAFLDTDDQCISLSREIQSYEDGTFRDVTLKGRKYSGKALYDFLESCARKGYYMSSDPEERLYGQDIMWFIWSNVDSPVYGKEKMATFERYFINEPSLREERKDYYYKLIEREEICDMILREFGMDPKRSHIVNGHMPVKFKKGESPIKGNGKLLIIDGGFSKAYQKTTGIAGYTLIYNSYGLRLVTHEPFESLEKAIIEETDIHSNITVVQLVNERRMVADTDIGKQIRKDIVDLEQLLDAYRRGLLREKR